MSQKTDWKKLLQRAAEISAHERAPTPEQIRELARQERLNLLRHDPDQYRKRGVCLEDLTDPEFVELQRCRDTGKN